MYSEQDMAVINGRIKKNWLVLTPVLLALLAAYVYALYAGVEWLAMVAGPMMFVAACYGLLVYLLPNLRYRGFLRDMQNGLSRDLRGTVVEISGTEELQDGARVLPVRVRLDADGAGEHPASRASVAAERLNAQSPDDDGDERIVYLNVSKRDQMPEAGSAVLLRCYGRHIRAVQRL